MVLTPLAGEGVNEVTAEPSRFILYIVKFSSLTDQSLDSFLASPSPEASRKAGLKLLLMSIALPTGVKLTARAGASGPPSIRATVARVQRMSFPFIKAPPLGSDSPSLASI